MPTYLDRVLAAHRAVAAADQRGLGDLVRRAESCPPARGFASALVERAAQTGAGLGVAAIAEVKRRSPSKGALAPDLDPALLAKTYVQAGAACLSVLTDADFFGGSPEDLVQARGAVEVPVLRKDFTVCPADVCDARLMGADAVLLIVGALVQAELVDLFELATHLGLDALVEVHDEAEAERAMACGARMIGVNQRDLISFEVDTDRAVRVGAMLGEGVVRVAESGIRSAGQVARLAAAGFQAVLVGEALVTAPDPGVALRALLAVESA